MFLGMLVLVTVFHIVPELRKKSDYERTRDRLNAAILRKKKEIADLRSKQQDFASDHEFVEYILHQNRMVWENETVFIFEQ
jgi:hypothetical protein